MIAPADALPAAFQETPIPSGPITQAAADAIARLLWDVAEEELRAVQPPAPTVRRRRKPDPDVYQYFK